MATNDRPEGGQGNVEAARNAFALKMAALHDLSVDLSLAENVDELCRRAVILGHRILGFDRISIWFVDPEDPALLYGSFGTDEQGKPRDERSQTYRRSDDALPPGFYGGKEPVYYMGIGPCFNDKHEVVGSAERALALIWDGRRVIGEICVDNLLSKRTIDGGSLELLVRYARIVGYLSSLKRAQADLRAQASIDELTGIVNRRTVLVLLEKQLFLATRKDEELSVIFCDLDGLKAVNDNHGHAVGDRYIRESCALLDAAIRGSDTVGRLGGDEFLIVLSDCDKAGAAQIDARIAEAIAKANAEPGDRPFQLSISRGIAYSGELEALGRSRTPDSLIQLADERMYEIKRAKKIGRA
jgi:diguanylate cyclase (GGDEF) domain